MRMLDWNGYRDKLLAGVGLLGKLSPDTTRGYAMLGGAGAKTGHLDARTRELIALGGKAKARLTAIALAIARLLCSSLRLGLPTSRSATYASRDVGYRRSCNLSDQFPQEYVQE